MWSILGLRGLLLLLLVACAGAQKQNQYVVVTNYDTTSDAATLGRYSAQLERPLRGQAGYDLRHLYTKVVGTNAYMDFAYWTDKPSALAGNAAIVSDPALDFFGSITNVINTTAYSVIRVNQVSAPVVGAFVKFSTFQSITGVTDQMFIDGTQSLHALYQNEVGYSELILVKADNGGSWGLITKWTNASAYTTAATNTATSAQTYWNLVDMTTKVDLDLSLTRTFTPSVGTPSTFVVLDEFLLKEGESRQVFLEKSAQAEAALRGETGYLGRNLLYSRQGTVSTFLIQWWWESEANYQTSLVGLANFDFALMIDTATQTRTFLTTEASFYPWTWDMKTLCGAPIFMRSYKLAPGVNSTHYLGLVQGADTAYRAEGFKENNILKNPATGMWLDMGGTYSNFTARVMAEERLASVPAAAAVNNARVDVVTTSLEYIKGFWPWEDLTYRCYTKMDVDPAVTGATWVDSVLRRAAPMHKIVLPPPGVMPNGKLSVFLPDFGKSPADYTELLETAASTGAVAIGLAYLNGIEVVRLCIGEGECFAGSWTGMLYGATDTTPSIVSDIAKVDSVTERLLNLLKYLNGTYPEVGAAKFYNGGLKYEVMTWTGAGIGGSLAFRLAQTQMLDRAVSYHGPVDQSPTGNVWLEGPTITPKDRWFLVNSNNGMRCRDITQSTAKANLSASNMICFDQLDSVALDTVAMASWQQLYTLRNVWSYTLGSCSTSGLTMMQITNFSAGGLHFCNGLGEVLRFQSGTGYAVGGCTNCNTTLQQVVMSVSKFGYDRGVCTEANPCRTIQFAVNQAPAGALINIQRGFYDENIIIPVDKSGLTIVGAIDKDKVPETHIKCSGRHTGADNICIIVHAPLVTMSRLSIIHDTGLPTQREIGVRIMPSAHSPVLQKTQLRRAAVLEVNPANGSRALEVLEALDVGLFDNDIKGTYQQAIHVSASRAAVLRNLIWGEKDLMQAGVLFARGAGAGPYENNSAVGNQIRGVAGDAVQVQSNMNLIASNKLWRNLGHPVTVCGTGTPSCLTPYDGTCAMGTVVLRNKLGWNQAGWINDMGCNTTLECHPMQSVNISSSCTPKIMLVNSTHGNDADCFYNDPARKCKTINGAINKSQAMYWIVLEDAEYTEAAALPYMGMVLRSNRLWYNTKLFSPPGYNGAIVQVQASMISLEDLHVWHTNTTPALQEIGIHVSAAAPDTTIEHSIIQRDAAIEPTTPGSVGVAVEGARAQVLENVFKGLFQVQLLLTSQKNYVWLNTIESATSVGILIFQETGNHTNGTIVRDNKLLSAGLDGIQIQGDGTLIEDNEVMHAQRNGIHLCTYSDQVGPGGACNWTSLSAVAYPAGNIVKDNRAIRSPVNFINDLNMSLNDFTMQYPQYEPIGILDPAQVLVSQWVTVAPSQAVVNGEVPLKVLGFWVREVPLYAKLAAGRDDCYGDAPVIPGASSQSAVDDKRNLGIVGPVSQIGEYRVCIKHRQDWEATENIVKVVASDINLVFSGAPNCMAAIQAEGAGHCGCWFRRGAPMSPYFLPINLPLSLMTSGDQDIAINMGCCIRNTPIRTTNYLNANSDWGLCKAQ